MSIGVPCAMSINNTYHSTAWTCISIFTGPLPWMNPSTTIHTAFSPRTPWRPKNRQWTRIVLITESERRKSIAQKNIQVSISKGQNRDGPRLHTAFGCNSCMQRKPAEGWHRVKLVIFLFTAENGTLCTERGVVKQAEISETFGVNHPDWVFESALISKLLCTEFTEELISWSPCVT